MCICVDCWLAIVSWVGDGGGAMALDWGSGPGPLKSNTQNNTLLKYKNKKVNYVRQWVESGGWCSVFVFFTLCKAN